MFPRMTAVCDKLRSKRECRFSSLSFFFLSFFSFYSDFFFIVINCCRLSGFGYDNGTIFFFLHLLLLQLFVCVDAGDTWVESGFRISVANCISRSFVDSFMSWISNWVVVFFLFFSELLMLPKCQEWTDFT